jgi:hypothetical protein
MYLFQALRNTWLANEQKIKVFNLDIINGYEIINGYKRPLTAFTDYAYHSYGTHYENESLYAIFRYGYDTGIRFKFSMTNMVNREKRIIGFSVQFPEYFSDTFGVNLVMEPARSFTSMGVHILSKRKSWNSYSDQAQKERLYLEDAYLNLNIYGVDIKQIGHEIQAASKDGRFTTMEYASCLNERRSKKYELKDINIILSRTFYQYDRSDYSENKEWF